MTEKKSVTLEKLAKSLAQSDVGHLRKVSIKILKKLEKIVDETPIKEPGVDKLYQKAHKQLFGSKLSLMAALEILSELVLKLESVSGVRPDEKNVVEPPNPVLSDSDVALVEAFVQKMQKPD